MDALLRFDRQAALLGAIVALAYFVLGSPWPLAVVAGLLVCAVKLGFEIVPAWRRRPRTPAPRAGSPEAQWLARAESARDSIEALRRSTRTRALADRCAAVCAQADASIAAMRRLAFQTSVVSSIARDSEVGGIRITVARRQAAERLATTERELLTRLEASALGLESVVARLAQILAIGDGSAGHASIDDLVSELDALGAALAQTEALGHVSIPALNTTK